MAGIAGQIRSFMNNFDSEEKYAGEMLDSNVLEWVERLEHLVLTSYEFPANAMVRIFPTCLKSEAANWWHVTLTNLERTSSWSLNEGEFHVVHGGVMQTMNQEQIDKLEADGVPGDAVVDADGYLVKHSDLRSRFIARFGTVKPPLEWDTLFASCRMVGDMTVDV